LLYRLRQFTLLYLGSLSSDSFSLIHIFTLGSLFLPESSLCIYIIYLFIG
jgi:hypothetical protein